MVGLKFLLKFFRKILKLHNLRLIGRSVFQKDNKYYLQVFLEECFYELWMLPYDSIGISEEIDINQANTSKECDICPYWYFFDKCFKYEPYLCIGCHNLMQKATNFDDVAIISVKGNDYWIHFWYMSKDDAINIMETSNLKKKSGLL